MSKPKDPSKVVIKALGSRGFFEKMQTSRIVQALADAGCFNEEVIRIYFTQIDQEEVK